MVESQLLLFKSRFLEANPHLSWQKTPHFGHISPATTRAFCVGNGWEWRPSPQTHSVGAALARGASNVKPLKWSPSAGRVDGGNDVCCYRYERGFLPVITLTYSYSDIVSDISSGSTWCRACVIYVYILTFILVFYVASILTYFLAPRHSFWHSIWHLFWHHSIWHLIYSDILSDILSGILSGIYSDIILSDI